MTFITEKQQVKQLIFDNVCEPPSRLKLILKRQGYSYVVQRRGGMVKYIVRGINNRSNRIEIKL